MWIPDELAPEALDSAKRMVDDLLVHQAAMRLELSPSHPNRVYLEHKLAKAQRLVAVLSGKRVAA